LSIIQDYAGCAPARMAYEPRAGEGSWATEAPRGLIYHRYRTTDDGLIEFAKIVPPTSQNQRQIELDLMAYLPSVLTGNDDTGNDDTGNDDAAAMACERLIRSYDPCISCATHFLKLEVERR
jgi:sulfhydrogenase subunit alpha